MRGENPFQIRMGDPPPFKPGEPPPGHQIPGHLAATSSVGGSHGVPKQMRTFAQILADEKEKRNILEIKLIRKFVVNEGNQSKAEYLSLEKIGELMFDVLKLKADDCERVAIVTNRYDTKEVMLKHGVDPTPYLTSEPFIFYDHEVTVRRQSSKSVQVTFKDVPLCIPDEEIINLCRSYGEPVNNEVIYKPSDLTRGVPGSTRFVEMKLQPGKQFENYYWMEGPLDEDQGGRITVLHPNQIMQCSHCLRRADSFPGGGKGKLCKEKKTRRGEISDYMRHLKLHHKYTSLKMKFRAEFPQLNSHILHNDGFGHMKEALEEEQDITGEEIGDLAKPEDKEMILLLKNQLSEANLAREQQVHEIAKLKASISKQEESLLVGMNKSNSGQINIRSDNFLYDEDSDTLKVLDSEALDKELELYCTASEKGKEKKILEMRRRVLSQVKGIERQKRGRDSSVCSVRSIYSGVGTVRRRSETENDDENSSKNPKLQAQSFLPTKKH